MNPCRFWAFQKKVDFTMSYSVALNENRMLSILFLHSLVGIKMSQTVLLCFHIISEIVCISNVCFLNWKGMTKSKYFTCMEAQQYLSRVDE